jgi:serine phosphatase RsbU (regulator of sigma subunit)
MIQGVMKEVEAFSRGESQTDDITMMVLRFNG